MDENNHWNTYTKIIVITLLIAGSIWLFVAIRSMLTALIMAAMFAYLFAPLSRRLSRQTRLSHARAARVVFLGLILVLVGIPFVVGAVVAEQFHTLEKEFLRAVAAIEKWISQPIELLGYHLDPEVLIENLEQAAGSALGENPGDFLATIQIGITLVGTTASVIGGAEAVRFLTPLFAKIPGLAAYADEIALGLIVVVIAYLTLVCGELLPTRLALRNAEKTALALSRPIEIFARLAYFPMRLLSISADLVLRLFRTPATDDPAISLEEIELVVTQGASDGVILPFEERLIYRVFDYADKTVSDVMTPRMSITSLDADISVQEALEKAKLTGFSRLPVYEQQIDEVVGYAHVKDLIWGIDKGFNLRQCLREIVFIPAGVTLSEAFSRLTKSRKHLAIILDEYGGVDGLLTLEDLLEVVFREIDDEHSPVTDPLTQKVEHEWVMVGYTLVTEAADLLKMEFHPRSRYKTIAGIIMTELGRIPSMGDQLIRAGYQFSVRKMDHLRIVEVSVMRTQGDQNNSNERKNINK